MQIDIQCVTVHWPSFEKKNERKKDGRVKNTINKKPNDAQNKKWWVTNGDRWMIENKK